MKRIKRHKVKTEQPETSSYSRNEDHDLAYYIHDRVELMHQVFSIIKYKDLKAMSPACVRNLPVGDLQELCTEELLGISSKRLLATLDGAEPPSDTESSSRSPSPDPMETISLDSISSDEEILSLSSKKKKHKHRHNSKSKGKKREKQFSKEAEDTTEVSKATRAGLTVLELLELQARARAIRAQLQNEQAKKQVETAVAESNTDDEVEIKEEEPDVVEISSGDEKPDLAALQLEAQKLQKPKGPQKSTESLKSKEPSKLTEPLKPIEQLTPKEPETTKDKDQEKTTVTRRVSDLIITVPQAKATRKIKLNRNKVTVTVPNVTDKIERDNVTVEQKALPQDKVKEDKKKKYKKKKKQRKEKEGSDHDEITLQLSDSEKMDLLEDLNDRYSSSVSSGSSSDSDSTDNGKSHLSDVITEDSNKTKAIEDETEKNIITVENKAQSPAAEKSNADSNSKAVKDETEKDIITVDNKAQSPIEEKSNTDSNPEAVRDETEKDSITVDKAQSPVAEKYNAETIENKIIEIQDAQNSHVDDEKVVEASFKSPVPEPTSTNDANVSTHIDGDKRQVIVVSSSINDDNIAKDSADKTVVNASEAQEGVNDNIIIEPPKVMETEQVETTSVNTPVNSKEIAISNEETINETNKAEVESNIEKESEKELSEGELTDRESSEVEAVDIAPVVVCISDDEKQKRNKKKKKKDKKSKKSKKSKQEPREDNEQNSFKDEKKETANEEVDSTTKDVTDDDVYEILELSDDSSCYEVEGTVLSKEPTADEIEALSARIDEINKEVTTPDNSEQANESEPETHMSWKDRYLDSNKVKRVLTTANILNALRKKNKELKKKIEDARKETKVEEGNTLEEGSIEHYQTLEASKFVNPVTEVAENETEVAEKTDEVTKDMKKDAKQLLKMYRKLLNTKKIKRREKKKKRKLKKKAGESEVSQTAE